jgi:uncharacterized repeat protein (TIGR02543 family)
MPWSEGTYTIVDGNLIFTCTVIPFLTFMGTYESGVFSILLMEGFPPLNFAKAQFTVAFNTMGGSEISAQRITQGEQVNQPTPPTRSGYIFDGWFSNDMFMGQQITFPLTVNGNITLFAKWTLKSNDLIFNGNGATIGTTATLQSVQGGTTVTLPTNGYTRTGYTFAGWNTHASGTGTMLQPGAIYTMPIGNDSVTLFARWTARTFTVTLDRRSGTGGSTSVTATFDSPMPSATAPTRNGYIFQGYFTEINGGGTQYYNANMTSARTWDRVFNTTLYAHWTIRSNNLIFSGNGATSGSVATMPSVQGGTTVTLPENEYTRTGYTFTDWNTHASGIWDNYQPGDTFTMPMATMPSPFLQGGRKILTRSLSISKAV